MYYVYIIYSRKLDNFYTDRSDNLKERISEHNSGSCEFTKKGQPWILAHYQVFASKQDAVQEEKFLKTGKGRERRNYFLKNFINKIRRGG